jgi:hypothetical protein
MGVRRFCVYVRLAHFGFRQLPSPEGAPKGAQSLPSHSTSLFRIGVALFVMKVWIDGP